MQLAPSRYQGLVFVPSLGVGTGVAGPLLGLAFFAKQRVVPKLHLREMLLPLAACDFAQLVRMGLQRTRSLSQKSPGRMNFSAQKRLL